MAGDLQAGQQQPAALHMACYDVPHTNPCSRHNQPSAGCRLQMVTTLFCTGRRLEQASHHSPGQRGHRQIDSCCAQHPSPVFAVGAGAGCGLEQRLARVLSIVAAHAVGASWAGLDVAALQGDQQTLGNTKL